MADFWQQVVAQRTQELYEVGAMVCCVSLFSGGFLVGFCLVLPGVWVFCCLLMLVVLFYSFYSSIKDLIGVNLYSSFLCCVVLVLVVFCSDAPVFVSPFFMFMGFCFFQSNAFQFLFKVPRICPYRQVFLCSENWLITIRTIIKQTNRANFSCMFHHSDLESINMHKTNDYHSFPSSIFYYLLFFKQFFFVYIP